MVSSNWTQQYRPGVLISNTTQSPGRYAAVYTRLTRPAVLLVMRVCPDSSRILSLMVSGTADINDRSFIRMVLP